jgi:choline dehydrogenase-like flavoprotein
MLVDARSLPPGTTLHADVCIIGAGPAGLALAKELSFSSLSIAIVESGGTELDPMAQRLSSGHIAGDATGPLEATRLRQVGGTSNLWGVRSAAGTGLRTVRYMPLARPDFTRRSWMPESGWPFGLETLEPFYERAQQLCGIGPFAFDGASWETPEAPQLPIASSRFATAVFQFGPSDRFTQEAWVLAAAKQCSLVVHATALQIEMAADGASAMRLRAGSRANQQFWVASRFFVLAGGAIENPRLLQLSTGKSGGALGNEYGLVGRYFMEHPFIRCGSLVPFSRDLFESAALYDIREVRGREIMAHLTPTVSMLEEGRLLNFSAWLFPRPPSRGVSALEGYRQLRNAFQAKHALWRSPVVSAVKPGLRVLAGTDYILKAGLARLLRRERVLLPDYASGGWSELRRKARSFASFEVFCLTEQAPDFNNRVSLSDERDHFGQPRPLVQWKWGELNARSLQLGLEALARDLAEAGLGVLKLEQPFGPLQLSHHHMGTTRMHIMPQHGVVDPNCRVHGTSNVFVAGSSVFPTGGYANPTFTIIALAVRLAKHLRVVAEAALRGI